ncbi:hypothetical protein LQ567_22350 [Niabella pedocola]|uniref:Uncharacterized protein n=1 Tax=Niabella pedocola TaxID=1752077 RepID=A0ABS8PWT6_9BACT|nr:hypothetical protein [Niabella pedocola]MCD2425542.1 hypothetical protein [Niabella pedocola]
MRIPLLFAQDTAGVRVEQPVDSAKEKTTLTIAALYGTGIDYYGQTTEQRLPYLALNATVRIPAGVYLSATGFHLFSDSLLMSAAALSAGYGFNITSKLSGDVSFTHTFFPSKSPFLQASSPNMASASLGYEYFLKTTLEGDLAFGEQTDYFTTLSNSKSFDINLSGGRAILNFTPELALTAGTQQYYETYLVEKTNQGKGNGNGNGNGKGKGNGNGNGNNPPGQTTETTIDYKKYGLLSYNLKLPVSYNRASYLIEAALKFSLLGSNTADKGRINSFFTLSAYYQF